MAHSKPKVLLYSHDTYGLGHLRRTLSVAEQLAKDITGLHQLIITGSMVAGAFGLPPRTDMVKLPALSKRSSGRYKARALPLSLRRTLAWREQMILQAVVNFKPHLFLVDKSAAGVHGELLPALRHLRAWSPDTKIVLGMRDIEDSPEATIKEWLSNDVPSLHDLVYDRILLYGQRSLFDPVQAYQMSAAASTKLVECGYLRRDQALRPADVIRRELNIGSKPLVLVTVGGGGDGHDIIKTYLEMVARHGNGKPLHSVVITGPLMPQYKRKALARAARDLDVTFIEFTPDLTSYMAAADLVISMAGYNTVCEILSLQKRALLIPRSHVRAEQRLRAQRLAQTNQVHLLQPEELTPARLAAEVGTLLTSQPPQNRLPMNGLKRISTEIANLLQTPSPIQPIESSPRINHSQREVVAL